MIEGVRSFLWSILFYGLFSLNSSAQTPLDMEGYTRWATQLTGYPEPKRLPSVVFAPRSLLQAMVCPKHRPKCRAAGAYPGGLLVYVGDWLPPAERDVIIVHEIVHYLQREAGVTDRCTREYEASRAEWAYAAIVQGASKDFEFNVEFYECIPSRP
jgi:hypothetical protein